jgi:transposase-like protein
MDELSIPDLAFRIPTEHDAYVFLEDLRWPDKTPVCPHCENKGANYIKPRTTVDGAPARATRNGTMSQRRLWQCKKCRKQFSAMTGTIFHGSKVPLRTWLLVIFEMCCSKNGMAAREIERKYKVAPKTAWFMAHRVREAMKSEAPSSLLGIIVADETWYGGDPNRMNKKTHDRWEGKDEEPVRLEPGAGRPHQKTAKTPVVSLINASTGEVRSAVVPNVDGHTLRKVIAEQVDMAGSELWTDEGAWYQPVGREFAAHRTVNHAEDEYIESMGQTTNRVEGYFSQLKRSIDGTYHRVSREHLQRYLTEFDFRYSTREMTDTQRMARLMGQTAGRRITYKRIARS